VAIARHIAADNPAASKRVLKALRETIGVLSRNPRIGMLRSDLREGLRVFPGKRPAHNYVILYYERVGRIEISAMIHGARNWEQMVSRGDFDEGS
jgi:plasmid stabilization system protein ParE